MSVRPGMHLDGRYRLRDRLGCGSRGELWRGTDQVLGRAVAVKILRPDLARDQEYRQRFRDMSRALSGLPDAGIVAVYDYGETRVGADGGPSASGQDPTAELVTYLVLELVPGEALASVLAREGALGADRTLDLVGQMARALSTAHTRGLVHGDVRPGNVLVTPQGRAKVTDFAGERPPAAPSGISPARAGTWTMALSPYVAPEVAAGGAADPLSDVFALGVVACECLAGHLPFEGDSEVAVALLPGAVSSPLRALVGSAMAEDPRRRVPSAAAFAQALEGLRDR